MQCGSYPPNISCRHSNAITILASSEGGGIHKQLKDDCHFCKQISYNISIIIIQLSLFEMWTKLAADIFFSDFGPSCVCATQHEIFWFPVRPHFQKMFQMRQDEGESLGRHNGGNKWCLKSKICIIGLFKFLIGTVSMNCQWMKADLATALI